MKRTTIERKKVLDNIIVQGIHLFPTASHHNCTRNTPAPYCQSCQVFGTLIMKFSITNMICRERLGKQHTEHLSKKQDSQLKTNLIWSVIELSPFKIYPTHMLYKYEL